MAALRPVYDDILGVWTVRIEPWCPPRWFKTERKANAWVLDKTSVDTVPAAAILPVERKEIP